MGRFQDTVPLKGEEASRVEGAGEESAPDASAFEFEGWAILELMGHRKLGGYVRMNGPLIRIDVHDEEKPVASQWYGGHSLYCLTPTTEAVAKRIARSYRPEPVTVYELALPVPSSRDRFEPESEDEDL